MSEGTESAVASESTELVSEENEVLEGQEGQEEGDKPSDKDQKAAEKKLKKLKIKFNGKEEDVEYDPDDEEYIRRQHQMAKLGQVKSQEYAALERQVQEFVEELKKNPRKILQAEGLGIDLKQLAAEILEEEIENSRKSPEQLEREKLESELTRMKEEREREKKDAHEERMRRLEEQEFERFDMLMTQAIDQSDLPKSPYVIKKMTDYLIYGVEKGYNISPSDIVPLVREEIQQDIADMFKVMSVDNIKKIVGKEGLNKLREDRVAQVKKSPPSLKKDVKDVAGTQKSKEDAPKKTYKEFFGI